MRKKLSGYLKELEGSYIFLDIEITHAGKNFRKGKVWLGQLKDFKKALVVELFFSGLYLIEMRNFVENCTLEK